ncbi:aspartyl-phosphate phosphatase Spo0E family protein [Oceanobacillus sp. Castelsardo]|uniref:aspartyl-phosphate phosphatase Spo0E family protein n=1 Tax=Oceanobacillus sp. Castelsardo TaxID=1851204 RepID=UPI0008391C6D|nr:aspartyl-phosphate phosphatase Spo0E family protein [Oceanobacillus sp. Castelsardo]
MNSTENVLSQIEHLRKKMTKIAMNKGFTDIESISLSQELDHLLNVYDNLNSDTRKEDEVK